MNWWEDFWLSAKLVQTPFFTILPSPHPQDLITCWHLLCPELHCSFLNNLEQVFGPVLVLLVCTSTARIDWSIWEMHLIGVGYQLCQDSSYFDRSCVSGIRSMDSAPVLLFLCHCNFIWSHSCDFIWNCDWVLKLFLQFLAFNQNFLARDAGFNKQSGSFK